MAFHLAAGLTPEAAGRICRHECRARCCRGSLFLCLAPDEVKGFEAHATALGVPLDLMEAPDGTAWVGFMDHPGGHCPMLDDATSECRIYADRPARCREFPEKARPDCPISGGDPPR